MKSTWQEFDQYMQDADAIPLDDFEDDLKERFRSELAKAPSLDENGYICTKDEALKAFNRAIDR